MHIMRRTAAAILCLACVSVDSVLAISAKPGLFDNNVAAKRTRASLPQRDATWDVPEPLKAPVAGRRNAIVILIEYRDYAADKTHHSQSSFENILFDSTGAVSTGSMREYYEEVSYGQFTLAGVVTAWLSAPQTREYYAGEGFGRGAWPESSRRLAYDAVKAADPYVDFTQFDGDGNGVVDALFIVHAGPGGEESADSSDIWSHSSRIPANEDGTGMGYMTDDGVTALSYAMEPEEDINRNLIAIGVFCHEYGHVLGLPDLYDRDYSSEGVGNWCLMAGGSWGGNGYTPELPVHPCAWAKERLGWVTPIVVTGNLTAQPVSPVETNPEVYRLWTNGEPGNEYFLVENRRQVGFDVNLYNSGLLIYHVDNSVTSQNDDENHKLVDLEEADGCNDMDRGSRGDNGDIYPGATDNRTFNLFSNPNSWSYAGGSSQVAVCNISASQPVMTADLDVVIDYPIFTFDDKEIIDIDGNSNGKADPGETVNLVVRIQNYGMDATGVSGKLTTDDPTIHFVEDETPFSDMPFNSSGDNSTSPFSFSVDETAPVHYAYFTVDVRSGGGDPTQFSFRIVIGHPPVLLVDDDADSTQVGAYDIETWYEESLDRAGEIADHWDCRKSGSPDSTLLKTYDVIIWMTGHGRPTLTNEDQLHLARYLDGGGRLFLTGQDIASELQSSSFLTDYLHAEWLADNHDETWMSGVAGDPIGSSAQMMMIAGDECAGIEISPDAIRPLTGANAVFTYQPSATPAGIKYGGGYKLVYFAFDFEAIDAVVGDPAALRGTIMANVMRWLRVVPAKGDVNEDGQVNILDVVWAVNIILELIDPGSSQVWASDCNGDELVNILDAIGIVNSILGTGQCASASAEANVSPEVLAFFAELQPYFSAADLEKIMTLVRSARAVPSGFHLAQNYPNPFNPNTTISYSLPVQSTKSKVESGEGTLDFEPYTSCVTLKIFNVLGQEVRTLVDEVQQPGSYMVTWNGEDNLGEEVSSGVYFYRLTAGTSRESMEGFSTTRSMLMLK